MSANHQHLGTIGFADQDTLRKAYDAVAEHTALYPEFYSWVCERALAAGVPRDAMVLDVGCGTGKMLKHLQDAGYHRLAGIDLSDRCVDLARQEIPSARLWQHNILDGPVERVDGIVMTEVIEHVTNPMLALEHVRASLNEGGWLILSFPNRQAYWPWYNLAPIHPRLPVGSRLRHWFGWFAMPYEMRSSQPIDHAYAVAEVRGFLRTAGFKVESEHGLRMWPMLRIPGLGWSDRLVGFIEKRLGPYLPRTLFYRYLFICRPA